MDDAIREYEQTIALDPQSVDALTHLAPLYLEKKRIDDAITAVEKALSIDPGNQDALFLQDQCQG